MTPLGSSTEHQGTTTQRAPVGVEAFPSFREGLPAGEIRSGNYLLRFADSPAALDEVLRLRFRVFNLELGEGLDESYRTGRDEDVFDPFFHHLMVLHVPTGEVVGTYRMQTAEMALQDRGFYSAGEFDLRGFPPEVIASAVEIGRACVSKEHRTGRVLHLLWRGLAEYLSWNRRQILFGCCSLTSQDPALGGRVYRYLQGLGIEHPRIRSTPLPGLECDPPDPAAPPVPEHIPALFQSYLNLGARIAGAPAIDRLFKTIDFLVILDVRALDTRAFRSFFR